jgi:serine/threonine protein kinase
VLSDVAQGMAHIHERGIIHRDLSVDNVLISEEERGGEAEATGGGGTAHATTTLTAKIADFGVCQVLSEEERYERERGYEELLRVRREQRKGRTSSTPPSVVDDGEKSDVGDGGGDGEEEEEEQEERKQEPKKKEKETDHRHLITVRGNMRLYAPEATEDGRYYSFPADVFMFGMLMYEVLEGRQTYQGSRTNAAIKRKMKVPSLWHHTSAHTHAPPHTPSVKNSPLSLCRASAPRCLPST